MQGPWKRNVLNFIKFIQNPKIDVSKTENIEKVERSKADYLRNIIVDKISSYQSKYMYDGEMLKT